MAVSTFHSQSMEITKVGLFCIGKHLHKDGAVVDDFPISAAGRIGGRRQAIEAADSSRVRGDRETP